MASENSGTHIKSEIFKVISFATNYFLQTPDWKENINELLKYTGEAAEVSRVYIFKNNYNDSNQLVTNQLFEWTADSVTPQIKNKNLQDLSYPDYPDLVNHLSKNKRFDGLVKNLKEPLKSHLQSQNIKSILLMPIFIEDDWWGFIGFDDCNKQREWDEENVYLVNIISDIIGAAINKTKSRKEIELSEQYFVTLFSQAPEAIAIVDPHGMIRQINEEFKRIFNYTEKEAINKNLDELISSPNSREEAQQLTKAAAKGEKINIETVRNTKDGVPVNVSITGMPIQFEDEHKGIYVIYRDISERKLAEKNLEESQTKFKTLFESSSDAIFLMKDDIFVDCNKAATKMFNTQEEELIGESPLKFAPLYQPDGRPSEEIINEMIKKAMENESLFFEFTHLNGNGKYFNAEVSLSKVVLKENTFFQAIVRDITERKKSETELKKAKEKAEESDRLKTAFLASMSHEIRTPMNHILGGLDLLLDPEITKEEKEEFQTIIKNSSNQLLKLIDDIIDVSQLDSGQLEIKKDTFPLQSFLNEIREETENLKLNNKVDFQINTSAHQKEFDSIHTDKVRLKQVLISLLSNAFKFTKEGTVELGYSKKSDGMLQFYVSDTGIGIPEESKNVIFEQFRQVDYEHTREYEGAGLGLTIAKGLVLLLGGNIWVESEEEKGSTFYFTIKTSQPKQKQKVREGKPAKEDTPKSYNWEGKNILIVEDEEMNYQYLKTVLKKTKANVLWAEDGVQGVEKAKENDVHVILMDIQLPEMNGYEATRQILKSKPDVPVIAQTAHALKEEKSKCFESGAVDYMAKPLNRKKLLEMIDNHII